MHLLLQALAVVAGVVLAGWQYWQLAYNEVEPPGSLIGPGLAAVAVIAAALVVSRVASAGRAMLLMSACLPGAIMLRVIVDTAADPTSHNLWPFEFVVALVVGVVPVAIGVAIGALLRRVAG